MGKQIIDLIGELVLISGNSTVDSIIFAIIGVISFLIAFGIVGLIFDAIGIYDSDLMSDTHWLIRVLVFAGLTWVGVKIAQLIKWLFSFQWWVYVIAGVVFVGIIILIYYIKSRISENTTCRPRQFGFVQTTHNEKVFTYAFNNTDEDIVISSVNEVFSTHEDKLYPEYLCMFFNRTEFDRYARFHSWGSARETFTWNDLVEVEIPIPDIEIQKSIASIYSVYIMRKKINEQLKAQIKDICPILIRGSLEEGK